MCDIEAEEEVNGEWWNKWFKPFDPEEGQPRKEVNKRRRRGGPQKREPRMNQRRRRRQRQPKRPVNHPRRMLMDI